MGNCCLSATAGDVCEATEIVSGGPSTLRACYLVALKLDKYQPQYANIPLQYTHKAAPSGLQYDVGTRFETRNVAGAPEVVTIERLLNNSAVDFSIGGGLYKVKYSLAQEPKGVRMSVSMEGKAMGLFTRHMQKQLWAMKVLVERDINNIIADDDVGVRGVVVHVGNGSKTSSQFTGAASNNQAGPPPAYTESDDGGDAEPPQKPPSAPGTQ